jgi:hypothetical protein
VNELRLLNRHVTGFVDEPRQPSRGGAPVSIRVPLRQKNAQGKRVAEAEAAHLLAGDDRRRDVATLERPRELMPK